jgi:hypothetical protein
VFLLFAFDLQLALTSLLLQPCLAPHAPLKCSDTAGAVAELADFFYATYKDTPKETLLEFLKQHPLIEKLRGLSQSELAIFICEQWALAADQKK